jgi:opacity protein-like surface antigen
MKKILMTALLAAFAVSGAYASDCASKAVGKDGKPLSGAAKTSFMKKCEAGGASACEAKAVSKDGKPLTGAAKSSFMKKCEADAKH